MCRWVPILFVLISIVICGCARNEKSESSKNGKSTKTRTPQPTAPSEPAAPHNLLNLTDRIYTGGEPHSAENFAALKKLGITTVVSVDGARPDVESARKHGLRYVHIPIGYDGVNDHAGRSLARLVREVKGPVYIHCHHGRHRGPAAAAVACLADGSVDHAGAKQILVRAGTGKNYAGLWRAVETYQVPAVDAELPELVETAAVDNFTAAMASIDRAFDHLKLCRDAEWKTPAGHPDLDPKQQALLLKEGFRESRRHLAGKYNHEFRTWLADAEKQAGTLERALSSNDRAAIQSRFATLTKFCARCHQKHRN